MYREFDIAFKSWNFIKNLDSDVYFSTWNTSKQYNKRLGIQIDEIVDEERILFKLPHSRISILDDTNQLSNSEKMIFHWKNALAMLVDSNIDYDYIILTRPDSFLSFNYTKTDLENKCASNRIYGLEEIQQTGDSLFIQDIFFMGAFNCMSKLIRNIPEKIEVDIHHHIAKHILLNGLFVEKIDGLYAVTVRANARMLTEDELTLHNIFTKTSEWGENQEQYIL
jgi:hypothetical protein